MLPPFSVPRTLVAPIPPPPPRLQRWVLFLQVTVISLGMGTWPKPSNEIQSYDFCCSPATTLRKETLWEWGANNSNGVIAAVAIHREKFLPQEWSQLREKQTQRDKKTDIPDIAWTPRASHTWISYHIHTPIHSLSRWRQFHLDSWHLEPWLISKVSQI